MDRKRRSLIVLMGIPMASTWVLAQQATNLRRIGYLGSATQAAAARNLAAFEQKLRDLGYAKDKNLIIELRYADGDYRRLQDLAAELVRMKVELVLTGGTPATKAMQKATSTIPIVTAVVGDPVGSGFASSLAKPGGNITGLTNLDSDLGAKRLQLLMTLVPQVKRVAFLVNPDNPNYKPTLADAQATASKSGVKVLPIFVRTTEEISRAMGDMKKDKFDGAIIVVDPFINQQGRQIAQLATLHRLPTVGGVREFAEAGGLASYGDDLSEFYRRAAIFVAKILNGSKPEDLPFEQTMKMALVVNTKTAIALGIKIPPPVVLSADEVIE